MGAKVGIFDADIHGPSLPTMISPETRVLYSDKATNWIQPVEYEGVKAVSFGYAGQGAAIMRGPMVSGGCPAPLGLSLDAFSRVFIATCFPTCRSREPAPDDDGVGRAGLSGFGLSAGHGRHPADHLPGFERDVHSGVSRPLSFFPDTHASTHARTHSLTPSLARSTAGRRPCRSLLPSS